MRTIRLLITALLCLLFFAPGVKAQDMQKKISLKVDKACLADVLSQLKAQYGFRFSYLNNDLATDTIYHFQVQETPLTEVLDKLLEKSEAGYIYHNGQIIIKKGMRKPVPAKEPQKEKETNNQTDPIQTEKEQPSAGQELPQPEGRVHEDQPEVGPVAPIPKTAPEGIPAERKNHAVMDKKENPSLESSDSANIEDPPVKEEKQVYKTEKSSNLSIQGGKESSKEAVEPAEKGVKEKKTPFWERISFMTESKTDSAVSPLHIGIFYPLSNHGTKAPQMVNEFSVHLLAGVSAGLEGWEFSGLGNIEKDYVNGYQFAGLLNVVGNEVHGLQFAGLLNKNGGNLVGGQFSGLANYVGGKAKGVQYAGLINLTGSFKGVQASGFFNKAESTEGVQWAGFMNVADSLEGAQLAGFLNKAGEVKGIQAAGFLNQAKGVRGGQFAGFYNKAEDVNGVQASGFINRARHVRGSQIGIINLADSFSGGIPIGLLSFVRNGYRAFEVYTGEDFHANIIFKTGVKKFYNILAVGLELNGHKRSGFGYGIGSEWGLSQSFYLTTDAIVYGVNEKSFTENISIGSSDNQEVNILNKLRVLLTWQPGNRLAFFGGPTYNLMVSRYQESPESPLGSELVKKTFFNRTNRNTNVKMWIGFNAGIRF